MLRSSSYQIKYFDFSKKNDVDNFFFKHHNEYEYEVANTFFKRHRNNEKNEEYSMDEQNHNDLKLKSKSTCFSAYFDIVAISVNIDI